MTSRPAQSSSFTDHPASDSSFLHDGAKTPSTALAQLSNVVKTYGSATVVNGVSLDVLDGRTTMLVGPNGSGKTTSMEILVGLRRPTSGKARILGEEVVPSGKHRIVTGVQLQQSGLPGRIKVKEVLGSVASLFEEPDDIWELAGSLGLQAHWNKAVDKLSGGLKRRVDIAAACVGRPRFLLLDEPTSGVDPEGRAELWEFLRTRARAGCGILASTHDLEEAEAFADQLYVMGKGRILLHGTPHEVLSSAGGDWRLRINDASPAQIRVIEESGFEHGRIGITSLVIGTSDGLERLRQELVQVDSGPEIRSGRIRLEDVFAVTSWREI
ncbi:ABC transporter ATP-binding protein [Neomicrococcus aestuarii]|uniref:ABC transporter ATP-binding protein n=1 Tax=Neomicrococcus aestuarii TaxID=556325 RepID=UPI0009FDD604|nr:ABC transporter ATP-binding protein [Neomicrococcus aestuarii]